LGARTLIIRQTRAFRLSVRSILANYRVEPLREVQIHGFATLMILGVSQRLFHFFYGLQRPSGRRSVAVHCRAPMNWQGTGHEDVSQLADKASKWQVPGRPSVCPRRRADRIVCHQRCSCNIGLVRPSLRLRGHTTSPDLAPHPTGISPQRPKGRAVLACIH
jgi:hypothetical protein